MKKLIAITAILFAFACQKEAINAPSPARIPGYSIINFKEFRDSGYLATDPATVWDTRDYKLHQYTGEEALTQLNWWNTAAEKQYIYIPDSLYRKIFK